MTRTSIANRFAARACAALAASLLLSILSPPAPAVTWTGGNFDWTNPDNDSFSGTYNDGGTADFLGSGTGTITVDAGGVNPSTMTVNAAASSDYTFQGGSIAGALVKAGGNALALTASNSFTSIDLGGGEILFTNSNQLGPSSTAIAVTDDTQLTFNAPGNTGTTVGNPTSIDAGKTMTLSRLGGSHFPNYSGQISGDGALRIESTLGNYWRISNAGNDFTGGVVVAGNAKFNSDGALGTNTTIQYESGTFTMNGATMGAGRTFNLNAAGSMSEGTWEGVIQGNGFALNMFGGTLGLNNAANSQTSMFNNIGTIRVGVAGSLGSGTLSYTSNAGNHLEFFDPVGGNFSNNLSMASGNNRTLKVEMAGAVIDWSGTISGSGDFVKKLGPGTFITSSWTATNNIDVDEGTLIFNDTDTAGLGPVAVASGATLGGSGEIELAGGNDVTIDAGGTLAPGDGPGTLSIIASGGGGLILNNTSVLAFELGTPGIVGSGVNDLIEVDGNLTLDGVLDVTALTGFGSGAFRLINYTGNLIDNGLLTGSPLLAIDTSTPGQVNLLIVPEPSTALLFALGVAGLARIRRRTAHASRRR